MAITHAGSPIQGLHGPLLTVPPELQVARTKFFGVMGTSEIAGGNGGRELVTEIWLYGTVSPFGTPAQIAQYITSLDRRVGQNGDLVVAPPGISYTWKNVTFVGFERGQWGCLPDLTQQLGGSWWCAGTLRFYQLSCWDDS
jgi:hypothetical protein